MTHPATPDTGSRILLSSRSRPAPASWLGALLLLGQAAVPALAVDLREVQISAQSGDRVDIDLLLSEPVPKPETFATDTPARIALDLPGVANRLDPKVVPVGMASVHSLVAVESGGRTRVVLNLTEPRPYAVAAEGSQIRISVNPEAPAAAVPSTSAGPLAAPEPVTANASPAAAPIRSQKVGGGPTPNVRDIGFRRGPNGEGQVQIRLPTAGTRVAVREEGTSVFIEVRDSALPQRLFRRLEVTDFGTPVEAVEARPRGRNVEIKVLARGDFEQMAYQTDDLFTLDFRALTAAEKAAEARKEVVYDGEKLSLNFQDIEVRAVLQVLADFMDLNLVASDEVQGNITLRLKDVPSDQALDIILESKGLSKRITGNVMRVAPTNVVRAEEHLALESDQKIETLAPLRTEFIRIKYAKAEELAAFLEGRSKERNVGKRSSSKSKDGARQTQFDETAIAMSEGGILSERGSVSSDVRTNTLVVMDTAAHIDRIRGIVEQLDIPVRQVMIESRVVIASNDFARDLGVRFGLSTSMGTLGGQEMMVAGGMPGNVAIAGFDKGPFGLNATTGNRYNSGIENPSGSGNQSLIVNLPAETPSGAINFLIGKVGSYLLQLELSAMQTEGRGEVVSSPRVITSDQQQAVIKVGEQIPYTTVSDNGTQTEFKEAMLQLDVTPHITPDDRIMMDLMVSKDNRSPNTGAGGEPGIETRSVETSVLVDNGETVVLGGVHDRQKFFNKEQVPWLGDVPVLGRLFKQEYRKDTNSELLIFVTPRILKEEMAKR